MSFLYELGISSFITNIADLLRTANSPHTDIGVITTYIDDLYWAAPFQKLIDIIRFVQLNGPSYGYNLNMNKCKYLLAPSITLTES